MVYESLVDDNSKKNLEIVNNEIKSFEKVKKVIKNVLKGHDLDIKDIVLSSDGRHLISCSEAWQQEKSKVLIWQVEEILKGKREPEATLECDHKESENDLITNWLLSVDTSIAEINNKLRWIICAGSINGDINIWWGDVNPVTKNWIIQDHNKEIFTEGSENQSTNSRAIFDIKILKDSVQNNSYHLYYTCNNIHVIDKVVTKDNTLKELTIKFDKLGNISKNKSSRLLGTQDTWIVSLDLYINKQENKGEFLISGSRDGSINKWYLDVESKNNPILVGKDDDSITCVKVFNGGMRIASSSFDNTIRIWENNDTNNPDFVNELIGHTKSVISLALQEDNKILISASKDNTVKVWDLNTWSWIRNIDINYFVDKFDVDYGEIEEGMNFLTHILITPNNRHIFAVQKNKIILLRNLGPIWHFSEQLKFFKKKGSDLYQRIYGENLKQIAKKSAENEESLKKLYEIIKKRFRKAKEQELLRRGIVVDRKSIDYDLREIGSLFVPSFIKFESEDKSQPENVLIKNQKEYITGVRDKYDDFWYSLKNLLFKLPDLPWGFRLFITTDMDEDIKKAKFVEITDPKIRHLSAYIILKDRGQSQVRILMVLEDFPIGFIPLLDNINIDIEDDRGDKDNLVFSDFTYSNNFIQILTNPQKSIKECKSLEGLDSIFFSHCIFQLDEGYSTESFANIFVRKISLEFTEKLNPLELNTENSEDIKIFEEFKKCFHIPIIPKIQVKIGKGVGSAVGKMMDEYFAKLILIDFLFSLWGFIEVGIPALFPDVVIPDMISNLLAIAGIAIILVIFVSILIKSRSKD